MKELDGYAESWKSTYYRTPIAPDWSDPDDRVRLVEFIMEELKKSSYSNNRERIERILGDWYPKEQALRQKAEWDKSAEEVSPSLTQATILMMEVSDNKENLNKSMDILYPREEHK
jgi:hypothetical protein